MRTSLGFRTLVCSASLGLLTACDDAGQRSNSESDGGGRLPAATNDGGKVETVTNVASDSGSSNEQEPSKQPDASFPTVSDAGDSLAPIDAAVTAQPDAPILDASAVSPHVADAGKDASADAQDSDPGAADARAADARPPRDAFAAEVRTLIEGTLSAGVAKGYGVAILIDDEVVFAEGFGTKNGNGDPVSENTLFQIGSDTKKLTALTVLQGVARGSIDLQQSVASQLDLELATAQGTLEQATVHDLLTHRSGLFGYTPWFDAPDDAQLDAIARGQFAANEVGLLPPGIAWCYSNAGYSLLGLLVEQKEQRPWATVLSEDVFTPLGLRDTYARRDEMLANESDIASGYGLAAAADPFASESSPLPGPGWVDPESQIDNAFLRPAGLVWSTASDQARLLGFLADGDETVLPEALRLEMLSAQVPMYAHSDASYGYGVSVQSGWFDAQGFIPAKVVGHGGTTLNMSSMSLLLPEQRVAVVILANDSTAGPALEFAAFSLLALAAGDRLPSAGEPPAASPPLEDFSAYAGNYYDLSLGDVQLEDTDAGLTIAIPALSELGARIDPLLQPVALDTFAVTIDGEGYLLAFYPGVGDEYAYEYAVSGLEGIVMVRQ